ncbi:hypothetical protein EZV62_011903 [Acer yangbiense]|uniref:Uncharacterized protein n=1 Tax=Acer yangbiense TaxID=1000413 RepID=A0A5C7I809_9ROSI|nr:hypothetical protein EZV62_011903 [Acer yangbiense]
MENGALPQRAKSVIDNVNYNRPVDPLGFYFSWKLQFGNGEEINVSNVKTFLEKSQAWGLMLSFQNLLHLVWVYANANSAGAMPENRLVGFVYPDANSNAAGDSHGCVLVEGLILPNGRVEGVELEGYIRMAICNHQLLPGGSSVHKPNPLYAPLAMIFSFGGMLICIVELVFKGRTQKVSWRWKEKLPWFYYPSQQSHQLPFGTFKDIIGFVSALCQCFVTAINFIGDNYKPIKISVWPKLLENP